jgi:type I site-specific restriction endonuclease
MNKKQLSERDICTKFITPAIVRAGWDVQSQVREEVSFTRGRVIVRGKTVYRGQAKRADYILYYKPNIPLAVIEAKDNNCAQVQELFGHVQQLQTRMGERRQHSAALLKNVLTGVLTGNSVRTESAPQLA